MAHTENDFTYQEALRTLGVTPEKLDHLIDEGAIPVISTGAQTLVPRESILAYLATVTAVGKKRGAARFADALQSSARSHYGHAGPRFVERIIEHVKSVGEEQFRSEIAEMIRRDEKNGRPPPRARGCRNLG